MLLGWEPGPGPHLSPAAWGPKCAAWTIRDVAGRELRSRLLLSWLSGAGVGPQAAAQGAREQEADWVSLGDMMGQEFSAEMSLRLKSWRCLWVLQFLILSSPAHLLVLPCQLHVLHVADTSVQTTAHLGHPRGSQDGRGAEAGPLSRDRSKDVARGMQITLFTPCPPAPKKSTKEQVPHLDSGSSDRWGVCSFSPAMVLFLSSPSPLWGWFPLQQAVYVARWIPGDGGDEKPAGARRPNTGPCPGD